MTFNWVARLWNGAPAALQAVGNTETGDSVQGLMKDESVARVEKEWRGEGCGGACGPLIFPIGSAGVKFDCRVL